MKEIPENVVESVSCLLKPYGVDFQELLRRSKQSDVSPEKCKYMTARQASMFCGLSAKTIRDKVLSGEIKAIKIGRSDKSRVLIIKNDFERWLEGFSRRDEQMA